MNICKQIPSIVFERLEYNKESGDFTWKYLNKSHPRLIGTVAGTIRNGYRSIKINGIAFRAHRLAWFMCFRENPVVIDHINGDTLDNRIINLRNVTSNENAKNHGKGFINIGKHCGVRTIKSGKFQARVTFNNKQIALGTFDVIEDAIESYISNKNKLYGEFSRKGAAI